MPIITITIGRQRLKCLVDTGSTTSIVRRNVLQENYQEQKLSKPLKYRTLNGINEVRYYIVTPFPTEFNCTGTLIWNVIDFQNEKYDAIIGQNFLIPLKTRINNEHHFIDVLGTKIFFNESHYSFHTENICSLEPTTEKNILRKFNFNYLNKEELGVIMELLTEFKDLFYVEGDSLSATNDIQHEIITTTDKPLYSKIYRYPQVHESEILRQVNDMLRQNIIRESNSAYNSPLWIVPKKSDNTGEKKWRIVIDYRKLNEYTVEDKYPIPNLNGILDKLGKAQYFTTIDLAKGFHQILVREDDRKKTAFSTPFGHYEFVRMPFGLKNAPSTFQRLMNSILRNYINKTCVVYMDDILVFSSSLSEHIISVRNIFRTLRKASLKIQIDKCDFFRKETQFLGHVLTTTGVKPDPRKVSIIQKLKLPQTEKQIKSFLGMTGFYRKFVSNYAKIAYPMTKYLKNCEHVNVNDPSYIVAFEKLKELVTSSPILRYPNFCKRFKIVTDASNNAIGAVLTQDGHPVAYASRTLNKHETNYATVEKELLAIVWGVKYFRPYIYGREFDLESDHQPLKWLMSKYSGRDISPRLQRYLIDLGEYQFKIEYIKGKCNYIADFLSRIDADRNEINVADLFEEDLTSNGDINIAEGSMDVQTIHSQEEDLHDNICILLDTVVNRFKIQIIITEMREEDETTIFGNMRIFIDQRDVDNGNVADIIRRKNLRGKVGIYSDIDDREYYKVQKILIREFLGEGSIKFLKCTHFAQDIEDENELCKQIALFHKYESGHSGITATYEKLKYKIYNPTLRTSIHKIINNCHICSSAKYDRNPINNKFLRTETPSSVNEIVHIDTYVNTKRSFIIFIDKFSKHAVCFHLPDRNSTTLVQKIREFLAIKGQIGKFIFDNEFNSKHVKDFLRAEKIEFHFTKPNSHNGNADSERLNNTLTERIRALNLEEMLPIKTQMIKAISCYNNSYHSIIKCCPFDVVNNKVDYALISKRIEEYKDKLDRTRNIDREDYIEHREEGYIKNYANVRHKEQPKFRKQKLENVHNSNIKRPLKFTDRSHDITDSSADANDPGNTTDQPDK